MRVAHGLLDCLLTAGIVVAGLYGVMTGQAIEQHRQARRQQGKAVGPMVGWQAAATVRSLVGWWRAWRQAAGWMKARR